GSQRPRRREGAQAHYAPPVRSDALRAGDSSRSGAPRRCVGRESFKAFGSCHRLVLALIVGVLLSGCTPPGPRSLLAGKKLIDRGKYARAIEKLNSAAALLPNNAQVWNY